MDACRRYVFLYMMQRLGWKRVGAIMENGKRFSDYVALLQDHSERQNMSFVATRKIMTNSSYEVRQTVFFIIHDVLY